MWHDWGVGDPMDRVRDTADALELGLSDDAWTKLRKMRGLWASYARVMNLVGPAAIGEQMAEGLHLVGALERHFGSLVLEGRWIDMGSGGGFPGLVLASCVSGLSGVLVEPRAKRCEFLELSVAALGVNWRVVRGRIEGARCTGPRADLVPEHFIGASARAVWDPATWLGLGRRWISRDGVVAVHLHPGDPDPDGARSMASCASSAWEVRLYGKTSPG